MSQHNESLANVHSSVNTETKTGWRKFLAFAGPAYLISVGYMDPGNWAHRYRRRQRVWLQADMDIIYIEPDRAFAAIAKCEVGHSARGGFGTGIKIYLQPLYQFLPVHTRADSHHCLRFGGR